MAILELKLLIKQKKLMVIDTGITGSATYSKILSKGFAGLLFNASTALNGSERITAFIESKGDNKMIFNDMALKDVLHLASYQDESKLKVYTLTGVSYLIELTADGGQIPLEDGEQLRIKLSGLTTSAMTYNLFGIEAPYISQNLFVYEEKIFGAGEKVRSYDVRGYDLFGIDQCTDFTEITLRWSNGNSTKLTTEEFQAVSSSLDPELFDNPPTASSISVIPIGNMYNTVVINGVEQILTVTDIEIVKPAANSVALLFRNDVSDWNKYHV